MRKNDRRTREPVSVFVLFLFAIVFLLSVVHESFAIQFTNRRVIISDSRTSLSNVTYTYQWTGSLNSLRCFKILFCTTAGGNCVRPTGLSTTISSMGAWVGLNAANWTLDNTTNGTLKLTNPAGEAPTANVSLGFLTIRNPTNAGAYFNRITTYSDIGCLTQVDFGTTAFAITGPGVGTTVTIPGGVPPLPPGGGGDGGGISTQTKVIFEGKAYPRAFLTLLKDGKIAATFFAEQSGLFRKELTGLSGGTYTFGIFAEDSEKRKSVTLSFTISILEGVTTTISGIFISPTIYLAPTQTEKGGIVNIMGQTFPESQINVFINSREMVKETNASKEGKWAYGLDTSPLEEGQHAARAKALSEEGEQSPFSQTLPFLLLKRGALICRGADLNFDGRVDIIDFSILLYFWGQTDPSNRCADINFDGKVNIFDFSIMMYWWSG